MCENIKETYKRWVEVLQLDTPEKQNVFSEMFERIELAETDLEFYRAVLDGRWPNAETILKHSLTKIR